MVGNELLWMEKEVICSEFVGFECLLDELSDDKMVDLLEYAVESLHIVYLLLFVSLIGYLCWVN